MIKEFISDYQDITVEKTTVNVNEVPRIIDGSKYSIYRKCFERSKIR